MYFKKNSSIVWGKKWNIIKNEIRMTIDNFFDWVISFYLQVSSVSKLLIKNK